MLGSDVDLPVETDVLRAESAACTGVWQELDRYWTQWVDEYPTVALCEVDPATGAGHLAVLAD